jgi:hypothetical protein
VPGGDGADLVDVDRVAGMRDGVVDVAVEGAIDRADPAQERCGADAAGDPDLLVAAFAVAEAAERPGQPRGVSAWSLSDLCRGDDGRQ